MSEETVCVFCEDPVGDDHATLSEDDDPFDRADRVEGPAVHNECLRRHRIAVEQTKRMFESMDKDYDEHTDIGSPVEDINEDELDAVIEALED